MGMSWEKFPAWVQRPGKNKIPLGSVHGDHTLLCLETDRERSGISPSSAPDLEENAMKHHETHWGLQILCWSPTPAVFTVVGGSTINRLS